VTGTEGGASAGGDARDQLVGRSTERALLEVAVDRALERAPQLVVIEGDPGVGKSVLARSLDAAMPEGHVTLWARGEAIERQLDFGVIDQLVREAGAAGLAAPPVLARDGARPDPLSVGQTILELAENHTARLPLLIVIDDAQWADLASVQSISYAYRRLHDRPVLVVVVQRPDAPHLESFHRLVRDGRGRRLRIEPFSPAAIAELVRARTGLALSPRAATRLHEHTGGSPLETVTLLDELDPLDLATGIGPLPAPRSYASLVLGRVAACSPAAEQVVAAVAVAGCPVELRLLDRLTGLDELAAPLSDAVDRGLLALDVRAGRRVVDVAHPLIRSAVLGDLAPSRLCRLHAVAAATAEDPDRAFVHRLRSVIGEHAELAGEAIARARVQLADGWTLSAVELLLAAAELLPPGHQRTEAVLRAAHSLLAAGDAAAATELLGFVPEGASALERLVRGEVALLDGDHLGAAGALKEAWEGQPEADVAARAAGLLATIAANRGRTDDALDWSRQALRRGIDAGSDAGHAFTMLASGWALRGDLAAGRREVAEWAEQLSGDAMRADLLYARGALCLWDGRLDEAVRLLQEMLGHVPDGGPLLTVASARYCLADAWYRQGRWDDSLALAEDLARTLDDGGQLLSAPMAHGVASFVLAGRGRFAEARRHLDAGELALRATGNASGALWLTAGRSRLALAGGDHQLVADTLLPLAAALSGVGLPEGVQPWRADLVDALVALDRLDEAGRELDDLLGARAAGGPHARAGMARACGNLAAARGDTAGAAAVFDRALGEDDDAPGPFARARLELAAGGFTRRQGGRRAAAELLDRAAERFASLGAAPFLERAHQERAACGLSPRRRDGDDRALTKAESAVAALVSRGHTNREVARDLVVSVKTVESHLARVFDKLGVRSRTELANELRGRVPSS
jgi:DNA-binding CsgD family transcriptional regulator